MKILPFTIPLLIILLSVVKKSTSFHHPHLELQILQSRVHHNSYPSISTKTSLSASKDLPQVGRLNSNRHPPLLSSSLNYKNDIPTDLTATWMPLSQISPYTSLTPPDTPSDVAYVSILKNSVDFTTFVNLVAMVVGSTVGE